MAIQYYDWNMDEEALILLDLAPEHPMVQLWKAWLSERAGNNLKAAVLLDQAIASHPDLIFPFRPEMIELFSWAYKKVPNWKWLYYKALTYWQYNQPDQAKDLFNLCGMDPDFAPFFLTKAELFQDNPTVVQACVEKAYSLDPASWRTGMKMVNLYLETNQYSKALQVSEKNFKSHSDKCMVVLQYANVLKLNGNYNETLKTLKHIEMLPAESDKWSGYVNAHTLYRETNILCAIRLIEEGKWGHALEYLMNAETWPENLGWGEPYFPDNRLTQFVSAYCHEN
jgi:tetratricopeptide (TPR) repeat protein